MENERVLCPYCGPWNGNPDGVEMKYCNLILSLSHWYRCPVCASLTPMKRTKAEARAAALRRFHQWQAPLTHEQIMERAAENAPVYVISGYGDKYWALLISYPDGEFAAVDYEGNDADGDFYGMREFGGKPHALGWIAFDHKPTALEIAAADWRIPND